MNWAFPPRFVIELKDGGTTMSMYGTLYIGEIRPDGFHAIGVNDHCFNGAFNPAFPRAAAIGSVIHEVALRYGLLRIATIRIDAAGNASQADRRLITQAVAFAELLQMRQEAVRELERLAREARNLNLEHQFRYRKFELDETAKYLHKWRKLYRRGIYQWNELPSWLETPQDLKGWLDEQTAQLRRDRLALTRERLANANLVAIHERDVADYKALVELANAELTRAYQAMLD
jgi:hypothetical protein